MAVTAFGVLVVVVIAGLPSRGVTWVIARMPDDFWHKLLQTAHLSLKGRVFANRKELGGKDEQN